MYSLIRSLLFQLEAERSHHIGLLGLSIRHRLGIRQKLPSKPKQVMGLNFANPIGLAAGLDKNASHIDALGSLGFGFVEVGTVTSKAQPGNPRPRLFRLPEHRALINRMGFNNDGIEALVSHLKLNHRYQGIIGVNIGKNLQTPITDASKDYLICLRAVYPYCDYVTVNISSPNTPGLRELQHTEYLNQLLTALKQEQHKLTQQHDRYVPLTLKIAPDLTDEELQQMLALFLTHKIDAIIATNTTVSRSGVENHKLASEQGGLSGAPLFTRSHDIIEKIHSQVGEAIPIIAVGGIMDANTAKAMLTAGAALLQVYTGLIYRGPQLLKEIAKAI